MQILNQGRKLLDVKVAFHFFVNNMREVCSRGVLQIDLTHSILFSQRIIVTVQKDDAEDACQIHTGAVPSLLAQLNSTALSLKDRLGVRNVARQMCYFGASFDHALDLLLAGRCSVF